LGEPLLVAVTVKACAVFEGLLCCSDLPPLGVHRTVNTLAVDRGDGVVSAAAPGKGLRALAGRARVDLRLSSRRIVGRGLRTPLPERLEPPGVHRDSAVGSRVCRTASYTGLARGATVHTLHAGFAREGVCNRIALDALAAGFAAETGRHAKGQGPSQCAGRLGRSRIALGQHSLSDWAGEGRRRKVCRGVDEAQVGPATIQRRSSFP
jgi:hypothetical protein